MHEYWKPKVVHGMEGKLLPKDIVDKLFYFKGAAYWAYHWEIGTPNNEKIFKAGLAGLIKEVEDKIKEIDNKYCVMAIDAKEYLNKRRSLEAMIIALNGAIKWSKRYAKLAKELATKEKEEIRREELESIATICDWVPEKPPRTLQEALQCFWFIHLIVNFIEDPQVGCGIRADQIFYSFYEKDYGMIKYRESSF